MEASAQFAALVVAGIAALDELTAGDLRS
jgi:hypothetical protein